MTPADDPPSSGSPAANPPPPLGWKWVAGRFCLLFLPTAIALGGLVAYFYARELDREQATLRQEGRQIAERRAELVAREMRSVASDLLYLSEQSLLRDFLSGAPAAKSDLSQEYLVFCRNRGLYDHVRVLDESGQEIVRVNYRGGDPEIVPQAQLQSKAARYYHAQALALDRGQVFVSRFDLNVEHDAIEVPHKPALRFATPVFDRDGAKRGVLVLNYLGERLLGQLAEVALEWRGAALLLDREGFYLRGHSEDEEWGFLLDHKRSFAKDFPAAWRAIQRDRKGEFIDDHGLFAFETLVVRGSRGSGGLGSSPLARSYLDEPAMVVVAHAPAEALRERPRRLLSRWSLIYGATMVLLGLLAGRLARATATRRRHERHIAESESRLRRLSAELLSAQERERQSISRDLHDDLGQLSTLVTIELERALETSDESKRRSLVERALEGERQLLARARALAARLRPAMLDDLGLRQALQSLLAEFESRTGVSTRAEFDFHREDVPATIRENLYRVTQEALNNVAKHSKSAEVTVALRIAEGAAKLTVRDSGVGLDPSRVNGSGLGLLGMRERIELLGGTFRILSQPGAGAEIDVTVPLPSESAASGSGSP